jgi:hypothetical protein
VITSTTTKDIRRRVIFTQPKPVWADDLGTRK